MALLAIQQVQVTGTEIAFTSASGGGGDTINPGNNVCLRVVNGDASPHDAVVAMPPSQDRFGQTLPDVTVTVPAGETRDIKLPKELAGSDGLIHVTYSATTSMTVAAYRT